MYHNLELTVAQYFTLHTFGYDGLMAVICRSWGRTSKTTVIQICYHNPQFIILRTYIYSTVLRERKIGPLTHKSTKVKNI